MGYFHPPYNHEPTDEMLDSLTELYTWKCDHRDIDPLGSTWYYGYGDYMDNIYGHQQVGSTACPGDNLYPLIPDIRAEVENRLGGGGGWSVIADTELALSRGTWHVGTMASDKYGADYLWTSTEPGGRDAAGWQFSVNETATYEVYVWWSDGTNRTTEAMFAVKQTGGYSFTTMNQQQNGGMWNTLGSSFFISGVQYKVGVLNDAPSGSVVILDAAKLVKH